MPLTTNDNFKKLLSQIGSYGETSKKKSIETPEYKEFIASFPLDSLPTLSLNQYCVGKGDKSFCWWLERGLESTLGRYSPGTSKGHLIYFMPDGSVYKNKKLSELSDKQALRYTLAIQAVIASADPRSDIRWLENDAEIYKRAKVKPLGTVSPGRKLRLVSAYHPEEILPITSITHIGHFLAAIGCQEADIPSKSKPISHMLKLMEYYQEARKQFPDLSPLRFVNALYDEAVGIAPTDEEEEDAEADTPVQESSHTDDSSEAPLNLILYGPPGTGKTYNTINQAMAILAPEFLAKNSADDPDTRKRLKTEFDRFVTADRVRFVTFHQSFSYEDFVEGLRADSDPDTGQVKYPIEAGVFKRICDDARTRPATDFGVRANPTIWKISIAGTGASPTKSYCLANGEARIGWGSTGDLRADYEQNTYYQSLGAGDKGTLSYFAEQMAVGDILLCIHSAEQIGSIGVVTSDYRFEERVPAGVIGDYQHVRSVRWLYRDINVSILPLNDQRLFTLKTVYTMNRFTWADLLSYLQQQGAKPAEPVKATGAPDEPYVLIIDEINRGNISRIFGELITLIEPSKREGANETLSVKLPYSKRPFSVPKNVYLIGTMNTADRSLAGMDIALRRRFIFKEMPPQPELLDEIDIDGINVGELLRVMNQRICVLLDRDHQLGHGYFTELLDTKNQTLENLAHIFQNQILPLLQEYFFEDWERICWVLNDQNCPPGVEPFVCAPKDSQNLATLFGRNTPNNLRETRLEVNKTAFSQVASYINIIGEEA